MARRGARRGDSPPASGRALEAIEAKQAGKRPSLQVLNAFLRSSTSHSTLVERSASKLEFTRVYHGMTPEEFLAPLRSRSRICWRTVISTSSGGLCQRTMRASGFTTGPKGTAEDFARPWAAGIAQKWPLIGRGPAGNRARASEASILLLHGLRSASDTGEWETRSV